MPPVLLPSDEIRDALPNSPTEDAPRNPFGDTQGSMPLFESNPVPIPGSHAPSLSGHSHPQVSPLTPPDHFDLHGYRQEYVHAQQAGLPRSNQAQYIPPLSFTYDGGVPQLWDMDGAPASPPPLPEFNLFMPPPPQQPPQAQPAHFAPPAAPHKAPPHPPPIFTHPPTHPPAHHRNRGSVPTISTPAHRGAAYHHSIRPPQPHAIRTSFSPTGHGPQAPPSGYHHPEAYPGHPSASAAAQAQGHSPQGYVPGSSPTNPNPNPNPHPLSADYRASFCKNEDESLDDHECLRLRLLEEAYRQRPPGQGSGGPAPVPVPGGSYGGPHVPSDQWANGGHRCVSVLASG